MGILCLFKTSRDLHMLFAAMMNLTETLNLKTLLPLKVEDSLMYVVSKWETTVFIIEQHYIS
jgi:hypothetical protein